MITRSDDGIYTVHRTYEDMRKELISMLQVDFDFKVHRKRNELKFKNEQEVILCMARIERTDLKRLGYEFWTSGDKYINFEITELRKTRFRDILESDPDYVNRKLREDGIDPENIKVTEMD